VQSIDMKGMTELEQLFGDMIKEFPSEQKALHEEISHILKEEVDRQIAINLQDGSGKIRGWQESDVGSGGGYAAIHAVSGKVGKNGPGAITNYLENGHQIRTPKVKRKDYHPRIQVAFVRGRQFYARAKGTSEAKAIQAAIAFSNRLADRLEG